MLRWKYRCWSESLIPESVSTPVKLDSNPPVLAGIVLFRANISGLPFSLNVLPVFLNPSFLCLKSLFGMILLANILNTLIQLDNSKHSSGAISRISEGRKIHILSCNIYYLVPLGQLFAFTTQHVVIEVPERTSDCPEPTENFQKNFPRKTHRNTHE